MVVAQGQKAVAETERHYPASGSEKQEKRLKKQE
jgi:hypothetical protein